MAGDAGKRIAETRKKNDENVFSLKRRRLTLVTPETDSDDDSESDWDDDSESDSDDDSESNSDDVEINTDSESTSPDELDSYIKFQNMYSVYVAEGRPKVLYDMGCIEGLESEFDRKKDEAHNEGCEAALDKRTRNKNILIDVMRKIRAELASAL
eukprot:767528-Heterocapsa_arctica.AAC.1